MILLDTSVLVYAVGVEHPLRDPCRDLVSAIGAGSVAATTTIEVIQEFAHVRARRRGRDEAVELASRFADLLAPLITVDRDDLGRGLELFRRHDRLGSFDAVLAAVAQHRTHVDTLVSADAAFAGIPGIVHLDPSAADFASRLGITREP